VVWQHICSRAEAANLRRGISSVFLLPDQGIEHILRLSPEVKIIFSLRDPIERNWSQIRMISTGKSEEPRTDLMRIAELPDVVQRANYPAIIARWSKFVPEDRMLILFMEDILEKPLELMAQVCKSWTSISRKRCSRGCTRPPMSASHWKCRLKCMGC